MSEDTLYDAMVRHQIYLEGYKSYQGNKFSDTAKSVETAIKKQIDGLEYDTLDELTKAQLRRFIASLKGVQRRLYDEYTIKLIKELEDFMNADYELIDGILDDTVKPEDQDKQPEDTKQPEGLWASILNDPIPGVGQLLTPFLIGVGLAGIVKVERLIYQAWSNGWTKKELLTELIGEPNPTTVPRDRLKSPPKPDAPVGTKIEVPVAMPTDRVGGVINRVRQENQSAINTVLQHLSQSVAEAAMENRFNKYQWVSVLDSRTTSICRGRNGNIYFYGHGPLPPAHINCRSHIAPYTGARMPSDNGRGS
jgi:SPP1 gp7 family putative phage head morphogenesis protein